MIIGFPAISVSAFCSDTNMPAYALPQSKLSRSKNKSCGEGPGGGSEGESQALSGIQRKSVAEQINMDCFIDVIATQFLQAMKPLKFICLLIDE
tara:strand:+ start:15027 stop:15308 length:282 start_codon:yes stop_codon:yes gene_type:complete